MDKDIGGISLQIANSGTAIWFCLQLKVIINNKNNLFFPRDFFVFNVKLFRNFLQSMNLKNDFLLFFLSY